MNAFRAVVAAGLLMVCGTAEAIKLDQDGCAALAVWSRDLVWARDMGADKKKVLAFLEESKAEYPIFTIILPIFEFLWDTKLSREDIVRGMLAECSRNALRAAAISATKSDDLGS